MHVLVCALNISERTFKTLLLVVTSEGLGEEDGRVRKETYFFSVQTPFVPKNK